MSGTVETVDDGVTPNPFRSDLEKTDERASHERIGDQTSHEMLEQLAPNGEGDYILEKINGMTEEEALAIIEESVKFHADDWNFVSIFPNYFCPVWLAYLVWDVPLLSQHKKLIPLLWFADQAMLTGRLL